MNESHNPKVMHIASGDLWAGAEVQLFTLVKTLHFGHGIQVSVILFNHGALEEKLLRAGIPVHVVDESRLNILQLIHAIHKVIRKEEPDVIHTHRIKENILVSLIGLLPGTPPSLRTVHGALEHPPSVRQPIKRAIHFMHWVCGRFIQRRVIAVSDDLGAALKTDFPANRVRVIENGLDLDIIQHYANTNNLVTGADRNHIAVGIAGRLVPVKRVDLFIETAHYLMTHHPDRNIVFHIFGDGPLHDELVELSKKLGTTGTVVFEGHKSNILENLKNLDMLLMTSDHEGLPMVLLEAMALQVPVIAHAVGGIPSLLENGSCGILVRDQTASAYAREFIRLADSDEMRIAIKKSALERVTSHYSASQNASAYLSEYISICACRA